MILTLAILSVFLIALVAVQSKGAGLSIISNGEDFGKFERRGAEKILHNITIVAIVIWTLLAVAIYLSA